VDPARALALHRSPRLIPGYQAPSHDLRIWSFAGKGELRTLQNQSPTLDPVALSPDGSAFFASAPGRKGGLWRWDLDDEKKRPHHELSASSADAIAWSADGKRVFAALANRELVLWNFSPWQELARAQFKSPDSITASALDRSGQRIVLGRLSGDLELRDAATLDQVSKRFFHYRNPIAALTFNPSGSWFAAGDSAGHIAVYDVATGNLILQTQAAPGARLQYLEFSHSGHSLLVARGDALALVTTDPDAWARLAVDIAGTP
jgi:WD40 repeat protein